MRLEWLSPPSEAKLGNLGPVATLGMFIIDHFQVQGPNVQVLNEQAIGGGGVFASTAARMFLPASHCGMIVDKGEDFPAEFKTQLSSYGDMIWFRPRQGLTTRALNIYSGKTIGEGHQSFKYLSPQMHLAPKDLALPPSPFADRRPGWVHVVCVTERAKAIAAEYKQIRGELSASGSGWDAKWVWEPLGRSCRPEDLDEILDVVHEYAVFSPNLLEMQSILSLPSRETPEAVVEAAQAFHRLIQDRHPGHDATTVIVRAGAMGAYTVSRDWSGWTPAFWTPDEQSRVVDVTGGGNSWMGGLCAGLLLTGGDFQAACIHASTAASFAIQQRGLPSLTLIDGHERWNGDDPWARLRTMARRADQRP